MRLFLTLFALLIFVSPLSAESALIDVAHYRAEVRFDLAARTVTGDATLTIRNAARGDLSEIPLDLVGMNIASVEVSGQIATYRYDDALLTIELPAVLPAGDTTEIRIRYSGSPGDEGGNFPWGGCHWGSVTYFMGVGFTDLNVSMMRRWLPSNDIPSDKATFDVSFVVPDGPTVAGSGILAEHASSNGESSWRWVEDHPTATYLFTYAISDYAIVEDEWNGIPMQYYVPRADSLRAVQYFSTVGGMMDVFTQRFGAYPFDKVGYCITPIGSMEHQTMISYAAQLFTGLSEAGTTAAHELSHMWWGDWVTCTDFRDAWLNEGFAVFSEMLYAEHLGGRAAYIESVRSTGQTYRISDTRNEGIFPLFDFPRAAPSSNYPSTIYHKGGAVMAMLRDVMGDTAFFDGLRAYGQRHAYGNATTMEFRQDMEDSHGSDLGWFFDEWVIAAGWPEYTVQRVLDDSSTPLRVRIQQTQDQAKYPLFQMPMDLIIIRNAGDTLWKRIDSKAEEMQEFSFPEVTAPEVKNVVLDPWNIVLKRISYRTVGVEDVPAALPQVVLTDLYPHPYSPQRDGALAVRIDIRRDTRVTLCVHDLLGRRVATLHEGDLPAGTHTLHLNGASLAPGVYMLLLNSDAGTQSRQLIVD
ncbi:MAG: T9SS type A sorting domain-containing protein [Bacteroidetes bacterium]|nr:T9SS type A sorting domain-containing protein [Bacteroidota bacterium]